MGDILEILTAFQVERVGSGKVVDDVLVQVLATSRPEGCVACVNVQAKADLPRLDRLRDILSAPFQVG